MAPSKSAQAVEALLAPVIEALGYELVDVWLGSEFGRRVLRILVDRPGGITIGECADLSREIAPHLDVADLIQGSYTLEVSSPGIQRPLKRARDFERFRGEKLVVRASSPIDGRRTFRGLNKGIDTEGQLVVEDLETHRTYYIALADVREAKLDPDIRF
jgi:ribosome maturation factor RimP